MELLTIQVQVRETVGEFGEIIPKRKPVVDRVHNQFTCRFTTDLTDVVPQIEYGFGPVLVFQVTEPEKCRVPVSEILVIKRGFTVLQQRQIAGERRLSCLG